MTSMMFKTPEMEKKKQDFLERLKVDSGKVSRIMNVEQRSDEWLDARKARLTGSVFGSALGHNKHNTARQLLKELLWKSFEGNPATRHGTENEPKVQKLYEQFVEKHFKEKCSFYYPGLIVCEKHPWLAGSPDGLPLIGALRLLLEIKCPFYKKSYPHIPHYYYDQIQGIMGILKLPYCDFVTWSKDVFQIRRFKFDPDYWNKVMFPGLEAFYMNEYLPRLILKEEGVLKHNELEPAVDKNEIDETAIVLDDVEAPKEFDFLWSTPVKSLPVDVDTTTPPAKRSKK